MPQLVDSVTVVPVINVPASATIPVPVKFLFGGVSGMTSTMFTQPLDLVKNRMQMMGEGKTGARVTSFSVLGSIIRSEGVSALYTGLSAGLLRQATYTTSRLGIYMYLFETVSKGDKNPPFLVKAALGVTAGGLGSFIGTPAEISLIRMTTDGRLPVAERRNYRHVFDAMGRMVREEGVLTLWRGCGPTVLRAMVVNAAQLATYSQAKQVLLSSQLMGDHVGTHFVASMISGLATTIASMPVDIAKTRIQNMRVIDGKPEYKGAVDVWMRVIRNEGLFSLWKGFTPYYMRLGPQTVLTFIFLEQLNNWYYHKVLGIKSKAGL